MKFIFASKYYYRRGGLESYLFKLQDLLRSKKHVVIPFSTKYDKNEASNYADYFPKYHDLSKIKTYELFNNSIAFTNLFFNVSAYRNAKLLCQKEKPDIFQGFGIAKHLSASVFKASKECGVPTVMRLSDFALICPESHLFDGTGHICENIICYRSNRLKCITSRCIQDSFLASMIGFIECKGNKIFNLYNRYVDHWIAPSQFIRDIFIKNYPIFAKKISYVPIFYDCNNIAISKNDDGYILYAGRLSKEKGIKTLLRAISLNRHLKLVIAGTGPIENELKRYVQTLRLNVSFLGFQNFSNLQQVIKNSTLVIIPSEWYENSPNIILESYAHGKCVIGSDLGGIPELIKNEETGYLFKARDHEDLSIKISKGLKKCRELGENARFFLENNFNEKENYSKLMDLYSGMRK